MADWAGGYTSEWQVAVVDPDTWEDREMLEGAVPGDISRDCEGDSPLLETGTITIDSGKRFGHAWLRVYLIATGAATEKMAIATMLFERDSRRVDHEAPLLSARGRSVLQPAAGIDLLRVDPKGYVLSGTDGADYAGYIIGRCTPAPVVVEGSFTLSEDIVFDPNMKCLAAAWKVLKSGNFCIQIEGNGTIHIRPMPSEPSLELGGVNAGLLIPGVSDDYKASDIPNRFTATLDGETATAVNDSPSSDVSYRNRGIWVDAGRDETPVLVNGEDLQAYAERRLAEESKVKRTFSYTREYWPDVTCFSLVRATMADNGIEGTLRVSKQTLKCGLGLTVDEEAYEEVAA